MVTSQILFHCLQELRIFRAAKLIAQLRESTGRSKRRREQATAPASSSQERACPSSEHSYFLMMSICP